MGNLSPTPALQQVPPPTDSAPGAAGLANGTVPVPTAPLVAIISTTADSADNIRRWVLYHRRLGVSRFYLFLMGATAASGAAAVLEQEPDVTLFRPHDDEALKVGGAMASLVG